MTFKTCITFALLAFASATSSTRLVAAQPQSKPDPAADRDATLSAKKLVDQAMALYAKADWDGARELLLKAWDAKPHRAILANLADVEMKSNRYLDAARHLQQLIAQLPAEPRDRVEAAQAQLETCRQELVSLRIEVNVPDATVSVNDQVVGQSPIQGDVFAAPGSIHVSAEHTDRVRDARNLLVGKGQTETVALVLEPKTKPAPEPPKTKVVAAPPPVLQAPPSYLARNLIVISGAVLSVAGATVGTVLWLKANDTRDDSRALLQSMKSATPCDAEHVSNASGCARLRDLAAQFDTEHNTAVGLFVGAGTTAVATTLTFLLWPSKHSPRRTGNAIPAPFTIEPLATRDAHGVQLLGTF